MERTGEVIICVNSIGFVGSACVLEVFWLEDAAVCVEGSMVVFSMEVVVVSFKQQ